MEYQEIRKFKDGTSLVSVNGRFAIVSPDLGDALAAKNMPYVIARSVSEEFPHMHIIPERDGIRVADATGTHNRICQVNEKDSPEAIYARVRKSVIQVECSACGQDPQYFVDHYINSKKWTRGINQGLDPEQ